MTDASSLIATAATNMSIVKAVVVDNKHLYYDLNKEGYLDHLNRPQCDSLRELLFLLQHKEAVSLVSSVYVPFVRLVSCRYHLFWDSLKLVKSRTVRKCWFSSLRKGKKREERVCFQRLILIRNIRATRALTSTCLILSRLLFISLSVCVCACVCVCSVC